MMVIKAFVSFAVLNGLAIALTAATTVPQASVPRGLLPDNPCALLSSADIEAATMLHVSETRRAPSIGKIVQAQRSNTDPGPGTICVYETTSQLGEISVAIPPRTNRLRTAYWEARSKYFQTFPGSARVIQGLGEDAWLAGGADLHILFHDDEFATVSAQYYRPEARELLIAIGRTIVERLR